jgi:tetratricopeptide (TPR) repeat protein
MTALYGPLVFFDAELLIPNLLIALLSWCLFVLSGRISPARVVVAGLLLGLAGIARPNALVLILPVMFLVFRRGAVRHAVVVLVLAVTPAIGVTLVNAFVEKTLVVVASQGGVNFYAGNHARASGRTVEIPELMSILSWRQFVTDARRVAEEDAGQSLDSREVSDWWTGRGLYWVRNHPADAVSLTARKAYYLVNAYEVPNNRDLYFDRTGVLNLLLWKTRWFAFPWGLVFPLAVVGWLTARRDEGLRVWADVLGLWILLYGLSVLPFFITARFRLGLLPAVLLLAALAIPLHRQWVRLVTLGVFLLTFVLVNSSLFGVRTENPAHYLALRGDALARTGQGEAALADLEQARAHDPGNTALANLLAEAYVSLGRYEEALVLHEETVAARPADPDVRFNLGVAYLALERFDDASNTFGVVVRLRPDDAAAWVNLGVALEGRRMFEEAVGAYREGIRLAPREVLPYLRLARLLGIEMGGIDVLEEGVRRNPESNELRVALAVADSLRRSRESRR